LWVRTEIGGTLRLLCLGLPKCSYLTDNYLRVGVRCISVRNLPFRWDLRLSDMVNEGTIGLEEVGTYTSLASFRLLIDRRSVACHLTNGHR
jgi:hypothetical protein